MMTEIGKALGRIKTFFTMRPFLSRKALAQRIGLHRNTINHLLTGATNPKADTLERVLREIDRIEQLEAAQGSKWGTKRHPRELQAA